MDHKTATVNMAEEVVSQTCTLCGTFDNAGNVSHNKGHALINIDNTQIGIQSGKMVISNLGTGIGSHRQEGGLTHIREAYETDVSQKLQF